MKANIPTEPQPPCENCGKEMVLKSGRYGPFYSCSGYPDCKNIRKIGGGKSNPPKPTGVKCPTCSEGELIERRSRRGIFYSCSRYPKCDFALNNRPVPRACPKCAAPYLLEKETKREGHIEYCNNPECDYRAPISPSRRRDLISGGQALLPVPPPPKDRQECLSSTPESISLATREPAA